MSDIKRAHDEEQAEARLEQAYKTYMTTMARINRDHEAHVQRLRRSERVWNVASFVCIVVWALSFVAAIVIKAFQGAL